MHLWQASGSRGRGRCVFHGSCEVGDECARDLGGTGATDAAGLFGLDGRHGGGFLRLFDGVCGRCGRKEGGGRIEWV